MYKMSPEHQISFFDFNQSCGMQLDLDNEWIQAAHKIDWDKLEVTYASMFPSKRGRRAFPFRMAFGARIIQKRKKVSDRNLVKEIAENPYLQYFIGLPGMQTECPFQATSLVYFRKRITDEFINEANEQLIKNASATNEHADDKEAVSEDGENLGTLILDATCSPSNIKYPQDFALLNDAREKLEEMIDFFHDTFYPWDMPRTYRRTMRGISCRCQDAQTSGKEDTLTDQKRAGMP